MKKGFSLIELTIVIGLVAVLASIGTAFSISSISRTHALSERDLLVSLLTQTRAKALANVNENAHGVYIDTTYYVIYEGTSYSEENPTNHHITRTSTMPIDGLQDITFQQLTADVDETGTIEIGADTQTYIIEINSIGRINW